MATDAVTIVDVETMAEERMCRLFVEVGVVRVLLVSSSNDANWGFFEEVSNGGWRDTSEYLGCSSCGSGKETRG